MSLRIFNTASSREELFTPVKRGKVGMYICGPTVYDYAHVGHAKTYLFYDIVKRYLKHLGYKVRHVQCFTDVDENIVRRALKADIGTLELSTRFEKEFLKDMDAFKVQRADVYPRTTEHIEEMIELVQRLIDNGTAYVAGGDVYFDISKSKGFGRLLHERFEDIVMDDLEDVEALNPGRKAILDFAIWKKAKSWEIAWDSPWGKGRPGWHTECAVMAHKYLGPTVDIHGGGMDLIFPHHESEGLLSEAFTGRPATKYWIHNQFVTFDGEKMSKSKGNLVTMRDAVGMEGADALRLYLLSVHYRKRMGFSKHGLKAAKATLEGFQRTVKKVLDRDGPGPTLGMKALRSHIADFFKAMDDDFDTPKAILALRDLMGLLRRSRPSKKGIEVLEEAIQDVQEVLGIDLGLPSDD
jgi:cysteinyl-tRNA synthetase